MHSRSSRPEVFCEKSVLRNIAKFTEKHLCQSLFCNKVAGLRPATLLKMRLWHRCFPVNFAKFLRTPFFTEHLKRLLLAFQIIKKLLKEGYNEGLFLLSSYVVLDYNLEYVILLFQKIYTCVFLMDVFNGCSLIQRNK